MFRIKKISGLFQLYWICNEFETQGFVFATKYKDDDYEEKINFFDLSKWDLGENNVEIYLSKTEIIQDLNDFMSLTWGLKDPGSLIWVNKNNYIDIVKSDRNILFGLVKQRNKENKTFFYEDAKKYLLKSLENPFPYNKQVSRTDLLLLPFDIELVWSLKDYFAYSKSLNALAGVYQLNLEDGDVSDTIIIWDFNSSSPKNYIRLPDPETVDQIRFLFEKKSLIVSSRHAYALLDRGRAYVRVFDCIDYREIFSLQYNDYFGCRFAISPDLNYLAVILIPTKVVSLKKDLEYNGDLGKIEVINFKTKEIIAVFEDENLGCWVEWSPCGRYLISGTMEIWSSDDYGSLDSYYGNIYSDDPKLIVWDVFIAKQHTKFK